MMLGIFTRLFKKNWPNIYRRIKLIKASGKGDALIPDYPIEHFYSPFATMNEIKEYESYLPLEIQGIDLNDKVQLELLSIFDSFYRELPFRDEKTEGLRYYFKNDHYSYSDAIFTIFETTKVNRSWFWFFILCDPECQ
ncbi:hypothetical protein [Treponema primitia]|uniref:hypothetical protein n=1 Tax=Treponema primitia TaxID=88058 RepID=UPI0006932AA4|nr:hypothetical protein [Treponema primitia]